MNPCPPLAALAALTALGLPAAAQTVWVVDAAAGPGADFSAIQPAVDAASTGDLVLIRPGTYAESVVVDSLGLELQADGGPVVVNDLAVTGVPGGTHVGVRGLDLAALGSLDIASCDGPVWIDGMDSPPLSEGGATGSIVVSDDVVLRDCRLASVFFLTAGLSVRDSRVLLVDCDLTGGDAFAIPEFAFPGAAGLELQHSVVFAQSSRFVGGAGAPPDFGTAGEGGWAITLVSGSHLEALDITTEPGLDGTGTVQQEPYFLSGNSAVRERPFAPRAMTLASPLREGETTTMTFHGRPGDAVTLLVAGQPSALTDLPRRIGARAIGTPQHVFPMGVVPDSGVLEAPFLAPEVPGERHLFYLQPVFLGSRGDVRRSYVHGAPTRVTILDATF